MQPLQQTRRQFLKSSAAVGGGLILGFHVPAAFAEEAGGDINIWVAVDPDDNVTIRYARAEMGQGSMTAAAQLVAEELGADWTRVRVEYVSTNEHLLRNRAWGDMQTVGSRTIRDSQAYLREGGAAARMMLTTAAAERWDVPVSECDAAMNRITHEPTGRTLSFGVLASAAARLEPPADPELKDPADWTLAGKSVPRLDIPDTVLGKQRFGIDAQLPGMVYAAIAQCPVFGGRVKALNADQALKRRGVIKVISIENETAVVAIADNWWRASQALKVVSIDWDYGVNASIDTAGIKAYLRKGLDEKGVPVARLNGDPDTALASAATVIEAEYYTPFQAHCTLEPQTCTVLIGDGRADVWTSTQMPELTHSTAAETAGLPPENVYVHRMQLGGGFGRKGTQDFTRQATEVAKTMPGTPVKLVWSREEDSQHDFYRPANMIRLRGGLDETGRVTALTIRVAAPSIFASLLKMPLQDGIDRAAVAALQDLPFDIPNVKVDYARRDTHVPVGFWRTVGHSQNPFARECFLDELAYAAGKDPLQIRRELLPESSKDRLILEATVSAAGWENPLPDGIYRGLAETEAYGSYTACVAELSVSPSKEITLHRIVMGLDCGHIVNPHNTVAQIEGSVVYGLTALFWGDITITGGRVDQSNFHDIRLMRLAEMPVVETVLAPTGGFWGGVGEPANAPVTPAVCNAIYAATGERVRSHPLSESGYSLKRQRR